MNQSINYKTQHLPRGYIKPKPSFDDHQRYASEQYQREARQRDDEAFRKIFKAGEDFWRSPVGVFTDFMLFVTAALPILVLAATVLMMLNAASSR